jgi:vacuolar protein sorting-associated protein VTA1
MPLAIPPELKRITPYVRRAEELDRDKANPESRLVAYYCRQYAVHNGIGLATTAEGKTALGGLLSNLEGEKEAMGAFTRDEAKFLCRKFADKIFDKADGEDRLEGATKNTARTFYAAASFLEMLQQFYQDDDESEEVAEIKKRSVYSKWKATDILKAMKEGREPTPGGYAESSEKEEEEKQEEVGGPSEDAPQVETVTEKEEEEGEEEEEPEPEPGRIYVPPLDEEDEEEEQGTEIELGPPPPAYPGPTAPPPPESAPPMAPKVTFTPPTPADEPELPLPPPPTVKPMPPPEPEKKKGSFFGMGKKKKKMSKAEISDAVELTKFALAALEDKNTDLAAERLQKALKVLGR